MSVSLIMVNEILMNKCVKIRNNLTKLNYFFADFTSFSKFPKILLQANTISNIK